MTADTLRGVNWSFALFFGMLASLSDVLAVTGVDRWLAGLVGDMTGTWRERRSRSSPGVAVLGLLASLVLRWQAAAPILTIATAPVAGAAGLSPLVVAIVATIACNGFVVPYQSTTYLALYHGTGGRLFDHRLARPAALAYALVSLRRALRQRAGLALDGAPLARPVRPPPRSHIASKTEPASVG